VTDKLNSSATSLHRAQRDRLASFMPSYGSLHSPSLKKYNMNIMDSRRNRFNAGNIVGDPFALASISISLVSWHQLCSRERQLTASSLGG
jgi:hypothetical protein